MVIDLHCHSSQHSACSIIDINHLLQKYIDAKVDGICITDHNYAWTECEKSKIYAKYSDKIKIFFAMELRTSDLGDILVFCKNNDDYAKLFCDMSFEQLCLNVDLQNTALIWAHPLRYNDNNLCYCNLKYLSKFDAIELYNGNLDEMKISYTREKFEPFGVKFTGGSDTHSEKMACKYATEFVKDISDIEQLVDAIKNREFNIYIFDKEI